MNRFTRRQALLAGFLAAYSLGFWALSQIPLWWLQVPALLAWLAGGVVLAQRGLAEAPRTEALPPHEEVPANDAPAPVIASEDELLEDLPAEPVEPPQQADPARFEPLDGEWAELLLAIEAEWTRAEGQQPAYREVLSNTTSIRENVLKSFEIADNLAGSAQRAFTLSEKVQKGITVVTAALVESLKQAEVLSLHSERITGILSLLSEVSDKIHVLSINASIVSARAGTAGRGFEVVAKEIRSLAKETEHSLGDIVEVIDLLRSSIARVIQVVRDADLETQQEKDSLIEVAGALQGVIMGVEIVKVVSGFAQETSERQETLVRSLVDEERGPLESTRQRAAALRTRLGTVTAIPAVLSQCENASLENKE